ncbi:MAG: N-acetyltransferase [Myxococcales bacterium]|nr:N-acetyltransferase [Myxococcales bacterium]
MDAFKLRIGTPEDDRFVARCFYQMWRDIGLAPAELLAPDVAEARVLEFLARGRAELQLATVIADDAASAELERHVGCAVCQRHALYPDILQPSARGYGYIWGVYVDAARRGAGLGARLTRACMDHLRAVGCTHAVLNAAPLARGLYERLGFTANNEMRVALT